MSGDVSVSNGRARSAGGLRGTGGWAWAVLAAACGVCAMVVIIQGRQAARAEEGLAAIRDLRNTRLDLANGFIQLAQEGEPGAPFARGEGMSLLRQATDRLEKTMEYEGGGTSGALLASVRALRDRLGAWPLEGMRRPEAARPLREAFHAVEAEAAALDERLQDALRLTAARNRRELVVVGSAAGVLLGFFCLTLLMLFRRGQTAAREARVAEGELRARERELSLIADHLPGLVAHFDSGLRYRFANEGYRSWFGVAPEAILGRTPGDVIGHEAFAREAEAFERARRGETVAYENPFATREGGVRHALVTLVPDRGGGDGPGGVIGLAIDVTERRDAEEALRELNAGLEKRVEQRTRELEAKNRELEMFTYSVSHDLKAPLRGIDGYSRLLLEDHAESLDEEGKRFLGHVRQASVHMGQLIDDLLAYSRLERRAAHPVRVRPGDLVRSLLDACAGEIETRGVVVAEAVPAELEVRADLQAFTMALRNLIDNALKFTRARPDARVEIGARREEGDCVLWVRDNGIGFDMRFIDRIFEIFQRLHRIEDYPGTGIGLAIVRKAMERMGGSAWAVSAPGEGATFFLKLPLHEP